LKSKLYLAFETSCDETCASVVREDLTVLSNVISSQIDIHKLYGGVVPEIASRNHAMSLMGVCEEALARANVTLADITHVCATTHPGLRGAVMCGEVFGKSLAQGLKVPFIAVNHLAGHIASVALSERATPPFLCLLVSGGHTSLYKVNKWNDIKLLVQTADDAVGECFDKVAKMLGLEYPGGVQIARQALNANPDAPLIQFVKNPRHDGFSYSGLKTAVLNHLQKNSTEKALICASFQHEAIMQLVDRSNQALQKHNIKTLCVCGGVSANQYLRNKLPDAIFPKFEYCTDNAAMIAAAAILNVKFK